MIKDLIFMGQIPEQLTREERRYKIFVDSYYEESPNPLIQELRNCIRKIENSLDKENYDIETKVTVILTKKIEKSFDSVTLRIVELLSKGESFEDEIEFTMKDTLFTRSRVTEGSVFKFSNTSRSSFTISEIRRMGELLRIKCRINKNMYVTTVMASEFVSGREIFLLPNVNTSEFIN